MPRMSASYRQFSYEPEILYEFRWARNLFKSLPSIAGALNLLTTREILALCHVNTESGRIINMWSDWASDRIGKRRICFFGFELLWLHAHDREYEGAMAAPVAPQIGVQNGTGEIRDVVFINWYIIQLMRVAPTIFPHSNFEMLYQFAGNLCEQLRQVRLSVESDQAEKDKEANIQFPSIDRLVEKYAQTIERSYVRSNAANDQALLQLASHCAQMGNQSAKETGHEEVGPDRDTDPGVKHSGKRFQAAPKTQISRWNNGVSKSRIQPLKVRNTGSNERIQAVLNSALADTLNSPDRLDAVKSNATIELDSVIEVDLTED